MRNRSFFVSLLTILSFFCFSTSVEAQNNAARQQQMDFQRQQAMIRQQQMDVQRQQQREQMREQARAQLRQQQESMRQQYRLQLNQQMRQQQESFKQQQQANLREISRSQQATLTKAQQEQQRRQLAEAAKAEKDGRPAPAGVSQRNVIKAADRVIFSNGVAKLTRPLTPTEIRRGFTGKLTSDGRALVRFQGRVFAVPASRVGVLPRSMAANDNSSTKWSTQQVAAVNSNIQKLVSGGGGGGSGGGGGGGGVSGGGGAGYGKSGITPIFNKAAQQRVSEAASFKSIVNVDGLISSRSDWPQLSDQLRTAAKEIGLKNFGMGSATREQSNVMGLAWVGEGHAVASDGRTLVSADGLRQYRPPSNKPNSGKAITGVQSNFEKRFAPSGPWTHNGHVDVVD